MKKKNVFLGSFLLHWLFCWLSGFSVLFCWKKLQQDQRNIGKGRRKIIKLWRIYIRTYEKCFHSVGLAVCITQADKLRWAHLTFFKYRRIAGKIDKPINVRNSYDRLRECWKCDRWYLQITAKTMCKWRHLVWGMFSFPIYVCKYNMYTKEQGATPHQQLPRIFLIFS